MKLTCALILAIVLVGCEPQYDKVQKDIWDSQADEIHKVLWEVNALPNEATPFYLRPPEQTAVLGGDCNDKCLLMLVRLRDAGFDLDELGVVVGYKSDRPDQSHMWLDWRGRVIDATASHRMLSQMGYRPVVSYAMGRNMMSFVYVRR